METYWKKELSDGTTELGTQSMIEEGKASWTKGRQDIISVEMTFARRKLIISAPYKQIATRWKLFDRWSVSFGTSPIMIGRCLTCYPSEGKDIKVITSKTDIIYPIPSGSELVCYMTLQGDILIRTRGIKE